jgi:hypothetical protein
MITNRPAALRPAPTVQPAVGDVTARRIPFDHTFRITLAGEPQRVHRTTVTVSVEASFTAVSIGYGVVPEVSPVVLGPRRPAPGGTGPIAARPRISIRDITLGELMDEAQRLLAGAPDVPRDVPVLETVLLNGIKLNPAFAGLGLLNDGNASLDDNSLQSLFQVVSAPGRDVQFLYALSDEGSGREFQSAPLLNTAGLGAADGKRPFRYFARPITFAPRATIRMEVTELSDFRGALHVSLHGYKILGGAGTPTGPHSSNSRRRRR